MHYHCPECKKAVNRDRILMLPWLLWLIYIGVAAEHVPPGAMYGLLLVAVSVLGLLYYFKRHP